MKSNHDKTSDMDTRVRYAVNDQRFRLTGEDALRKFDVMAQRMLTIRNINATLIHRK